CHLNDLENIPVFLVIGLLYVAINPVASTAILHYRIFTAARFIHNVAYLLPLPPAMPRLRFHHRGLGHCIHPWASKS
ncbi:hypothetical protein BSL78_26711, partial [Apostichopus japonicus]